MKKILKLALTDFKLIFRDTSLRAFLVLPVILFALIVWFLPPLVERYEFLRPYLSLFIIVGVIENTQMFSFISSMVLIEEKETKVAQNYGVAPLSKWEYLLSRFLIPYLFTALLNIILLWVQPFFTIGWTNNLVISLVTALVVPLYVLGINSIVQNRLQGMVWIKAFNMIVLIPIAAFFTPGPFKHLFGLFPTHWIFQAVDRVSKGLPVGWLILTGGLFLGVSIWWVARIFIRKHFV